MLLLIETAYGRSGEKLDVAREVCLGPEALKYALVSLLGNNVESAVRYRFQPASGLESCMGNLKLIVMKPLSYIAALQWQNKKVVRNPASRIRLWYVFKYFGSRHSRWLHFLQRLCQLLRACEMSA